jgi:hypothetical protein
MSFGGFYKGEKKKVKKSVMEKKALKNSNANFVLPQVEIIKKGKKDW